MIASDPSEESHKQPSGVLWDKLPPPPEWPDAAAPWLTGAGGGPKRLAATRKRFTEWLASDEGRRWFHLCLTAATTTHDGPAAAWWRALRRAEWCPAFPDLNPDQGWELVWSAKLEWPSVESAAGDGPTGRVVRVRQFAPTADAARVVISDGAAEPGSALARFHPLYATAGPDPAWWGGGNWSAARTASFDPNGNRTNAERLCLVWLDLLPGVTLEDPKLSALRAWAEGFGLTVLPAGTDSPDAGCTTRRVLSERTQGEVWISRFGLLDGTRVVRGAELEESLGRGPVGLLELERAAEGLPEGNPLRVQAHRLQEALAGEYLQEAAIAFYTSYWGDAGTAVKASAPDASAAVERQLTRFLHDAFGLSAFIPTSVREYPDEWLLVAGGRAMSGLVRRVLRPGLRDEQGNLRIPAIVEVE